MASFTLEKGSSFAIDKGIKSVVVGLGWDVGNGNSAFDIDAHAFGCVVNENGPKFHNDGSHAVTYANNGLTKINGGFGTADGSIFHTGDNRTGAGDGDDEQINIDLSKVPAEINAILVFITIHEAAQRRQNFGMVNNAYIHLLDKDNGQELCRYDLQREFSNSIAIQVGSLLKEGDKWNFKAEGFGTPSEGLGEILNKLS